MTPIYTITGIPANYGEPQPDPRKASWPHVFGWFPTLVEAEGMIQSDTTGFFVECLYTRLVVEEVHPGLHNLHEVKGWYRWEGSAWEGRWVACEQPEYAKGIVNWAF